MEDVAAAAVGMDLFLTEGFFPSFAFLLPVTVLGCAMVALGDSIGAVTGRGLESQNPCKPCSVTGNR